MTLSSAAKNHSKTIIIKSSTPRSTKGQPSREKAHHHVVAAVGKRRGVVVAEASSSSSIDKDHHTSPNTTPGQRTWQEIESILDQGKQLKKEAKVQQEQQQQQQKKQLLEEAQKTKKRQKMAAASFSSDQDFWPSHRTGNKGDDHEAWVDDGLGGRYNAEGYTGRIQDGVKIFKAHVWQRPEAGQTDQCPFDCDCCFI